MKRLSCSAAFSILLPAMTRSAVGVLALLGSLQVPVAAFAQDAAPLIMQPSTPWGLDYGEDKCSVYRTFAADAVQVTMQFDMRERGHLFPITLASAQLDAGSNDVAMRFVPDTQSYSPTVSQSGGFADGRRGAKFSGSLLPAADIERAVDGVVEAQPANWLAERAATIEGLLVSGVFAQPVMLETGALDQVMVAVRACLDDLYEEWGYDPGKLQAIHMPAQRIAYSKWAQWLVGELPQYLIRTGYNANVLARLEVGIDGRVSDCTARDENRREEFETYVCESLIKRARYVPARDVQGNPVVGTDVIGVRYILD